MTEGRKRSEMSSTPLRKIFHRLHHACFLLSSSLEGAFLFVNFLFKIIHEIQLFCHNYSLHTCHVIFFHHDRVSSYNYLYIYIYIYISVAAADLLKRGSSFST